MSRKTLLASLIFGLAVLVPQPAHPQATGPTLAGSWQFTLTPASPTLPPAIPIPGLVTFTTDGSLVETNALEVVPSSGPSATPTFSTPGHGIWQPGPAVTNFFVQFISIVANPNGSLAGRNVTTMTVSVNSAGSQFSGSYTTTLVEPTGQVPKTTSGTVTGQRIPHPKLP